MHEIRSFDSVILSALREGFPVMFRSDLRLRGSFTKSLLCMVKGPYCCNQVRYIPGDPSRKALRMTLPQGLKPKSGAVFAAPLMARAPPKPQFEKACGMPRLYRVAVSVFGARLH